MGWLSRDDWVTSTLVSKHTKHGVVSIWYSCNFLTMAWRCTNPAERKLEACVKLESEHEYHKKNWIVTSTDKFRQQRINIADGWFQRYGNCLCANIHWYCVQAPTNTQLQHGPNNSVDIWKMQLDSSQCLRPCCLSFAIDRLCRYDVTLEWNEHIHKWKIKLHVFFFWFL